jgi:hypothetical protein
MAVNNYDLFSPVNGRAVFIGRLANSDGNKEIGFINKRKCSDTNESDVQPKYHGNMFIMVICESKTLP